MNKRVLLLMLIFTAAFYLNHCASGTVKNSSSPPEKSVSVKQTGGKKPSLAILPFTGGGGSDGDTIGMLLGNQEGLKKVFSVVPRTSNINAIMKEQQYQRSGLTDSDTIAKLGKQLNADYVVAGHIQSLGKSKLVLITIIHVESFQQIAGDYIEYKDISEMHAALPGMAKRLADSSQRKTKDLPKLAVVPFTITKQGVNIRDAEVLAQLLATEIANSGVYAVLPRTSSIEQVMKEQKIQREGLTDKDSIKAIGTATNAKYVLAGSITSLGSMNMFFAQILNVEKGTQRKGTEVEYKDISDGLTKMADLSYKLTGVESDSAMRDVRKLERFVLIKGGTFMMGSPSSEVKRINSETQYKETLSSFYMSKYEITQAEYEAVMGKNPSAFKGADLPVNQTNWYDAIEYCNKRSLKDGLSPAYTINGKNVTWDKKANGYRLPTEVEWEYACRAGTTTPFNTGNNITTDQANYNGDSPYNNNAKGKYRKMTTAVGSFKPNAWGLYDMHGNVSEWCWDWHGSLRVFRGGSWFSPAENLRSAFRDSLTPSSRVNSLGFRIVRH